MGLILLFGRERPHHNSIVTLLGALEREGLADECALQLCPWKELPARYAEAASAGQRSVVACSLTTSEVSRFAELLGALRALLRPGDLVIAGGAHPTAVEESVLALGVDVVFRGEADRSFPQFIEALLRGREWRDTRGISFRDGSRLIRTPLPEPIEMDRVRARCDRLQMLGSLEITRGCPQTCSFCQTPRLGGHRARHRSPESVVEESAHYVRSRYVRLLSPNAFGYCAEQPGEPNVGAIVRLLETIRGRYPPLRLIFGMFPSEVRPEYVRRDLVRAIRPLVANPYLAVGGQSGSDRVLALARRGHTAADVLRATELIRGEGMQVLVDVLFGLPGETAADVRLTLQMMERIEALGGRCRAHVFTPLPGTPLADAPRPSPVEEEAAAFLTAMARRGGLEGSWRTGWEPRLNRDDSEFCSGSVSPSSLPATQ